MLLPGDVVESDSKAGRSKVELKRNDDLLPEYTGSSDGNTAKCYVAVGVGDYLAVDYAINTPPDQQQLVDIYVDGILRESSFKSRRAKVHRGTFEKVCFAETPQNAVAKGMQHYKMRVDARGGGKGLLSLDIQVLIGLICC